MSVITRFTLIALVLESAAAPWSAARANDDFDVPARVRDSNVATDDERKREQNRELQYYPILQQPHATPGYPSSQATASYCPDRWADG